MLADAHVHLAALLERDPGFPERMRRSGLLWTGCAASHDDAEWTATAVLRDRLPPFVASFGIHPQWAVWDQVELLERLAAGGEIAAIGEAGFDFFGDRPERRRDEGNEAAQRAVFEYQLGLAEKSGISLLLHLRKAMDLAFEYAPRLKRLRAAVFHSYPGSGEEALSLLAKGVNAYFSFGAAVLNGHKRARAACATLPEDRLLSETDAPWQAPRRISARPEGKAPTEAADWCRPEDLELVVAGMAELRGVPPERLELALARNFAAAYFIPAPLISG